MSNHLSPLKHLSGSLLLEIVLWYFCFLLWCGETWQLVSGAGRRGRRSQKRKGDSCGKLGSNWDGMVDGMHQPWMNAPTAIAPAQRNGMKNFPAQAALAPTNRKPDDEIIACQMPNGEHFLFIYNEHTEAQMMKHLGQCAYDPDHPLTWANVAQMTKLMRAARLEREWMRGAE